MSLFAEMLKSIPGIIGIRLNKEPKYCLVFKQGKKEIRHYEPYLQASTWVEGDYEYASGVAFRRLADYIFGNNKSRAKLPMTAPVLQQNTSQKLPASTVRSSLPAERGWQMSFILANKYKLANIPQPNNRDIWLEEISDRSVATIQFSGELTETIITKKTEELHTWLKEMPKQAMTVPRIASYDPPFTLSFLKRHELQIDTCSKTSD